MFYVKEILNYFKIPKYCKLKIKIPVKELAYCYNYFFKEFVFTFHLL